MHLRDRYTPDGSPALEDMTDAILRQIGAEVAAAEGANLLALVLGGGYGRGEGAVVQRDGREALYNDLDFTLVVRRRGAVRHQALQAISARHAAALGIHVDFSRPLTPARIRHWPRWLMWYDLLNEHVVVQGPATILRDLAPRTLAEPLPVIEATRLLLNRGAGLLWALRVLRGVEPLPDADFIRRNYWKCALALGDALLIGHQCYATPYRGRDVRLHDLAARVPAVAAFALEPLYRTALQFKFRPDTVPDEVATPAAVARLAQQWCAVLLHVESLRTGRVWDNTAAYAAWRGLREPDENRLVCWPRNIVRNAQNGACSVRHAREHLYRQLPGLLGDPPRALTAWQHATHHFLKIWQRCN